MVGRDDRDGIGMGDRVVGWGERGGGNIIV